MASPVGRLFRRRHRAAALASTAMAIATAACTLLNPLDGLSDGSASGDGAATPVEAGGDEHVMIVTDAATDVAPTSDGGDATTSSRYAAAVLADSPLLYYRFGDKSGDGARDEVTGQTTPYSVSGFTFGTPGALAGDPDTAVTATDGSGFLQLAQNADFEGSLPHSIEAWVSPSPAGNAIGFLVDHESFAGSRQGWVFRVSTNDVGYERYSPPDASPVTTAVGAGITAVTGQWHYVVATFDGTTMRLYIDGVKQETGASSVSLPKIGGPFTVGKQNCMPCTDNSFVGMMDELAIYPKALAEDRIAAHLAAAR